MPRKKVIRSQRQEIFYLPQINQSPTSTTVFAETLKRALKFADHFKKESVAVTYDLAIAKIAMQMQATETPTYDKVFAALGAFHIELSFLSASEKYIAESAGLYILNEAKTMIVAKDLISFWYQHLEFYYSKSILGTVNKDYDEVIADITENVDANNESSSELQKLFKEYEIYHQKTLYGAFGET